MQHNILRNIAIFVDNEQQFSLYDPWVRALEKLGYSIIIVYQMDVIFSTSSLFKIKIFRSIARWSLKEKQRSPKVQRILIKALSPLFDRAIDKLNTTLLDTIKTEKPLLLIVFKGLGIKPKTIVKIREDTSTKLANFNGDSPFNMYSSNQSVILSIGLYHYYFTWSKRLVKMLISNGKNNVHHLPFGYDSLLNYNSVDYANVSEVGESDVVFVGTWDVERENVLEQIADLGLKIWGPHWNNVNKRSALWKYNCIINETVKLEKMSYIYRKACICLNPMRSQNKSSHNMKSFEIPSMGGFLVTQRTVEHLELFKEDEEAVYYDNVKELREKIEYYQKNEFERRMIQKNGMLKARLAHSYLERMKHLISIVDI